MSRSLFSLSEHLLSKAMARVLPDRLPDFCHLQAEALSSYLPYQNSLSFADRTIFNLADGAAGTLWELEPVAHEILSKDQIEDVLSGLCKLFQVVNGERVTFQFIYEARPSDDFQKPDWYGKENSFARQAMAQRIEAIKTLAAEPGDKPRLMQRRVFLSLRFEWNAEQKRPKKNLESYFLEQADILDEAITQLSAAAKLAEDMLAGQVKIRYRRCSDADLNHLLKDVLSDTTLNWQPDALGIGEDTLEVISWWEQASAVFDGMMTDLLKVNTPIRAVLNVRPTNNLSGLEALANAVKNGGDAKKERQRDEVYDTEKRLAYGEKLLSVSLHLLYLNAGLPLTAPKDLRGGSDFAKQLTAVTNIPLMVEKQAALPVFLATLPLCYSRKVSGFLARESRVLSESLSPYLPIFSGTKGSKKTCQLMQSRAGEALWLSLRSSPTNPHLAVLGSSGGGKSFWLTNYILSELAEDPDLLIFHIDCITSCEFLARTVGEEIGCEVICPPQDFPNLFAGEITPERLPTIVSIIDVAVSLVSGDKLNAAEKVLLSDAILKTYQDNLAYAAKDFVGGRDELGFYESKVGAMQLPRLSSIVDSFNLVCQLKGIDEKVGIKLREKLLPLFGSGPYAHVFDLAAEQHSKKTPGYSLYDLQGIQGDKILTTLASLIITSEISRQLAKSENKGRKGLLIIDECGVNLGGGSKELEDFVKAKWVTFRKRGIVCIGLTNNVDHYTDLPAPATIWNVSSTKLILPMNKDDIKNACRKGLITDEHHLDLMKSLQKKKGEYSECLWLGENIAGSFSYVPTGFDYWLAINQDADVQNLEAIYHHTKSYQKAVSILAARYPMGVTDEHGDPRRLSEDELRSILEGE